MNKYYAFGPLIIEFNDFYADSVWNLWKWKLDAFAMQEAQNIEVDVVVSRANLPSPQKDELLRERKAGFFKQQVWSTEDKGLLWQELWANDGKVALQYYISSDWKQIILLQDNTNSAGLAAFEYLTHILFYAMLKKEVLTFHGTLLECEGNGVILSAPSGVGKTTHARLWRDVKNALVINGDRSACYYKNGEWVGFGVPWCGTSGEYMNRMVPIKALVVLEQGPKNVATKLSAQEYVKEVFPHIQYPAWDMFFTETALDLLQNFLNEIPVYKLVCTPDAEAVTVLYAKLKEQEWK